MMPKDKKRRRRLTDMETHVIIIALRTYQRDRVVKELLTDDEIDELCEALNFGDLG